MYFSLNDDQTAFRDAVRDLLARTPPEAAFAALADMGLFGALVPEADGGLGLSEVDIVPVLMEVGYACLPGPVAETVVCAPLLSGDARLADVLAGKVRIAVAGVDGLVPYGGDLVLTSDGLVARTLSAKESTVDPGRPLYRLPDGGLGVSSDRLTLATAAQLVGLGARMLDLTTAYVGTRHQFGVPVGSFQAVKHHLADALLELEFATPAVLAAAWSLSVGADDARSRVAMATVLATEAATRTARTAIQCHGAIGYTVEYELHRYAKRAWALAATVDIDAQLNLIGEQLGVGP